MQPQTQDEFMKPKDKSVLWFFQGLRKLGESKRIFVWGKKNDNRLAFRILFIVRFLYEMVHKYNVEESLGGVLKLLDYT